MNAKDILAKPYTRRLVPDETGGYVATIQEFPGLVAEGETANEAIANLESAAESWLEALIDGGHAVPEPISAECEYSGRIALRLPKTLHRKAAEQALAENTSLNQWLIVAVSSYAATAEATTAFAQLTEQVSQLRDEVRALSGQQVARTAANVYLHRSFATGHAGISGTFVEDSQLKVAQFKKSWFEHFSNAAEGFQLSSGRGAVRVVDEGNERQSCVQAEPASDWYVGPIRPTRGSRHG